eukprot:5404957-Pleurochrysis_carterae.AAC.1
MSIAGAGANILSPARGHAAQPPRAPDDCLSYQPADQLVSERRIYRRAAGKAPERATAQSVNYWSALRRRTYACGRRRSNGSQARVDRRTALPGAGRFRCRGRRRLQAQPSCHCSAP